MRVLVYVDGFNLYYRALRGTPYRWLNLDLLARRLVRPGDTIDLVRYFTARVKARAGDPDAPRRQQIYLSALGTVPNIEFHFGNFLTKTKKRPLASVPTRFVEILDTEEKGSDVNLAVHLVNDAWSNHFDVALVLSQDTDLIEPLRMVSKGVGKPVGLVWLDGRRPDRGMANASSFVRHVSHADLIASQFPAQIARNPGSPIIKPTGW
ncbi:MAG: NYN domain-containing protein [Reyranella sp.]|nr:NYN domain-containing protein [Reyranella sp.]